MLRRQLRTNPETLGEFELAAEERYWDGCQLLTLGHDLAGVYLLGYTAEMILKHACFRTDRAKPGDPVGGFFGPVRSWMKMRHPAIDRDGYHSLIFWAHYLRGRRRQIGQHLPEALDRELLRCARRLHQSWSVELRYRPWLIAETESVAVYNDVTWLRDIRVNLWS